MLYFRDWIDVEYPDFVSEGKNFDKFKSLARKAVALGLIGYHVAGAVDPSSAKDLTHRKEMEVKHAAKLRKERRRRDVLDLIKANQEKSRKTA